MTSRRRVRNILEVALAVLLTGVFVGAAQSQRASGLITEQEIAALQKELAEAGEGSSTSRKRRAYKSVVRDGKAFLKASFPQKPELAFLDLIDTAWPNAEGRPEDHQFKGYTLDDRRRPTFRYHYLNVQIDDTFAETMNQETGKLFLRRSLTFTSRSPHDTLVFRVAENSDITAKSLSHFQIGKNLEITVSSEKPAQIISGNNNAELRVSIPIKSGTTSLMLDYNWQ